MVSGQQAQGSTGTGQLYRRFVGPLLSSDEGADAEQLSQLTLTALGQASLRRNWPLVNGALAGLEEQLRRRDPRLEQTLFGCRFSNPVGLAAGFDKNAVAAGIWHLFGFGFAELGTITWQAQEGNPRPRLFRLAAERAALNRMGFNNDGMEAVAQRLAHWRAGLIVGCNLGKNKDTPLEDAHKDYLLVMACFYDRVDYFTVNVSSPNTPQLRQLQESAWLKGILLPLVAYRNRQNVSRPIFLKIAPDLDQKQILEVAETAVHAGIEGIIATNTTIDRATLTEQERHRASLCGEGGMSGAPLTGRSTEVTRQLLEALNGRLPVVASGGIMTLENAEERFRLGVPLVQLYTGFVYAGPGLIYDVARAGLNKP